MNRPSATSILHIAFVIEIPILLDRLCYRFPSMLVDRDHRARARPAPRRRQERHGQRGVLPGPLSRRAADAGAC